MRSLRPSVPTSFILMALIAGFCFFASTAPVLGQSEKNTCAGDTGLKLPAGFARRFLRTTSVMPARWLRPRTEFSM